MGDTEILAVKDLPCDIVPQLIQRTEAELIGQSAVLAATLGAEIAARTDIPPGPIATLQRWNELHRSVKPGEKALVLCMPVSVRVKDDDAMLRGYGLVFLGLNLYTRFFEWFWDSLNKGLFFIIVGLSLWGLGAHAERLWNLGKKPSSSPKDA